MLAEANADVLYWFDLIEFRQHSRSSADGAGIGSNPWPKVCALLRHRACDGRPLHLALVVDDHSSIVFEVDELAILPSEGLPLSDDDGGHHLLPELGLSLLHGAEDHVPAAACWQPVEPPADPVHSDHVQVLGSCIVGAVHDRPDRAGQGNPELCSCCSSASWAQGEDRVPWHMWHTLFRLY